MQSDTIEQALGTLEDILVRERDLLLAGRARETAEMVSAKMSALEVVDAAAISPAAGSLANSHRRRIETIQKLAGENAAYFAAVRNGVRSLVSRFGRITDDAYVGAYGAGGAQTPFTNATGGYLKKV